MSKISNKIFKRDISHRRERGQALVEYILILTLVIMALAVVLSATGPAVGNVFSDAVAGLLGDNQTPEDPMSEGEFWDLVDAVASYTPDSYDFFTNTPPGEKDSDSDGILDNADNCKFNPNADQTDTDGDGVGDICDADSDDFDVDNDGDGFLDRACNPSDAGYGAPLSSEARQKCGDNCIGIANADQADVNGNDVGDACEAGDPPTATDGPSPTPRDVEFTYPFTDTNSPNNFENDFTSILKGPWLGEFWNEGSGGCSSGDLWGMTSAPAASSDAEERIIFPRQTHSTWKTLGSSPHPDINNNFCARYSQTFNLQTGSYTWRVVINDDGSSSSVGDRVRIKIDGVPLINEWGGDFVMPAAGYAEYTWNVTAGVPYDIEIEFADVDGNAQLEVYLLDGGLVDSGLCDWTSIGSGQSYTDYAGSGNSVTVSSRVSGNNFWSDSPAKAENPDGLYGDDAFCILRLRGTVNLVSASFPYVSWWEQHAIALPTDTFWFGVREVGESEWYLKDIHSTASTNYSWTQQEVNLTNFTGVQESDRSAVGPIDFSGKQIEVAFIIETDSANNSYGWWITDFEIQEKNYRVFAFPFFDDLEGANNWYGEGTWDITSTAKSGAKAWTDSPAGNFTDNENSSLYLDGVIDMRDTNNVQTPELAFWHRWELRSGDRIYAEVSKDFGETWLALRSDDTDTTDYLYDGGTPNLTYKQEVLPLSLDSRADGASQNFIGERIMVRFRLETNGWGQDDGWYIDDIIFRNKPVLGIIFPDWCDTLDSVDSLSNYILEGSWGLEGAPVARNAYSGGLALSDSLGGNYVHNSNATATLDRIVDISGNTNPILEFWHRWEVGRSDRIYVEISEDEGATWREIWAFADNQKPDQYDSSVTSGVSWDIQRAWVRQVIFLNENSIISPSNTDKTFMLRWGVDATVNSGVDDGWYIDNICLREYNDPMISVPYQNGFEGNINDTWYVGNDWGIRTESHLVRAGDQAVNDSPGSENDPYTDNIMELKGVIDLTASGLTEPTLYFWSRLYLDREILYAEVQRVDANGVPLGNWIPVRKFPDRSINQLYTRQQVDLTDYLNEYIRLRFRTQNLTSRNSWGWILDEVSIVDRVDEEIELTIPFTEDVSLNAANWVREGEWSIVNESRSLGSGTALGPGQWLVTYYEKKRNPSIPPFDQIGVSSDYDVFPEGETVPEINFNWGNSAPALVETYNFDNNDYWIGKYERTLVFNESVTFDIQVRSDDGHKIFINNALFSDQWYTCGNCSSNITFEFTPGEHTIVIWHFENSGGAKLDVDFTRTAGGSNQSFDPFGGTGWDAYYFKYCNNTIETPAWNDGNPELVANIDFDWSDGAPSIVTTNNTGGGAAAPGGPGGTPFEPNGDGNISIPAERPHENISKGGGSQTWQTTTTAVSGMFDGTGMQAVNGNNTGDSTAGQELRYDINVPAAGNYYVYARAWAAGGSNDSIHVAVNDETPVTYGGYGFTGMSGNLKWLAHRNSTNINFGSGTVSGDGPRIQVSLDAGMNQLIIYRRERGVTVDHFWLTPTGQDDLPPESASTSTTCDSDPSENWAAEFTRNVTVSDSSTVIFNLESNDGHRFYVRPFNTGAWQQVVSRWGNGDKTSSLEWTFPPGTHGLRVEYLALSVADSNHIKLEYSIDGPVFHTDAKNSNYEENATSSVILEHVLILPGGTNPALTWWDRYDIGKYERMIVEVNTVNGYDHSPGDPLTWTTVYDLNAGNRRITSGWRQRFVDLSAYAGQNIVVRFRFDALNTNEERDGWYIDDIQIAD